MIFISSQITWLHLCNFYWTIANKHRFHLILPYFTFRIAKHKTNANLSIQIHHWLNMTALAGMNYSLQFTKRHQYTIFSKTNKKMHDVYWFGVEIRENILSHRTKDKVFRQFWTKRKIDLFPTWKYSSVKMAIKWIRSIFAFILLYCICRRWNLSSYSFSYSCSTRVINFVMRLRIFENQRSTEDKAKRILIFMNMRKNWHYDFQDERIWFWMKFPFWQNIKYVHFTNGYLFHF